MQEAIRRSLAEEERRRRQQQPPPQATEGGGGGGGEEDLYRPLYPHVPVAEVVSVESDGRRLPSYEEATQGVRQRRQQPPRG